MNEVKSGHLYWDVSKTKESVRANLFLVEGEVPFLRMRKVMRIVDGQMTNSCVGVDYSLEGLNLIETSMYSVGTDRTPKEEIVRGVYWGRWKDHDDILIIVVVGECPFLRVLFVYDLTKKEYKESVSTENIIFGPKIIQHEA